MNVIDNLPLQHTTKKLPIYIGYFVYGLACFHLVIEGMMSGYFYSVSGRLPQTPVHYFMPKDGASLAICEQNPLFKAAVNVIQQYMSFDALFVLLAAFLCFGLLINALLKKQILSSLVFGFLLGFYILMWWPVSYVCPLIHYYQGTA